MSRAGKCADSNGQASCVSARLHPRQPRTLCPRVQSSRSIPAISKPAPGVVAFGNEVKPYSNVSTAPQALHRDHARHTSELILDKAEELIALKGVFGFHLKDIAAPLGIRVPAIYKHFRSRDDVLISVSRRFVNLLSRQFELDGELPPRTRIEKALASFVDFNIRHPAYVRLALVDFATPEGGMEYVRLAAGGPFKDNFSTGPLAPMHRRLRRTLDEGARTGEFCRADPLQFYRVIYGTALVQLVFPEDSLLFPDRNAADVAEVKRNLIDVAMRYLDPR